MRVALYCGNYCATLNERVTTNEVTTELTSTEMPSGSAKDKDEIDTWNGIKARLKASGTTLKMAPMEDHSKNETFRELQDRYRGTAITVTMESDKGSRKPASVIPPKRAKGAPEPAEYTTSKLPAKSPRGRQGRQEDPLQISEEPKREESESPEKEEDDPWVDDDVLSFFDERPPQEERRQIKSKSDSFLCDHCGFRANSWSAMKRHTTRVHDKNVLCALCDFSTYSKAQLESHVNAKHLGEQPHACDNCDFASANAALASMHRKRPCHVECDKCDYVTYTPRRLQRHRVIGHSNAEDNVEKEEIAVSESPLANES